MSLTEKLAGQVTKWCLPKENNVSEEEQEILIYGYTLFFESLYKTALFLLIAVLTGTFFKSLIIFGSFGLLRSFAGGIHCRSGLGCTVSMLGMWGIGLLVSVVEIPLPILAVMMLVVIGTICLYAPQSTKNNPIQDVTIYKQKRKNSILVMCLLFLVGIGAGFGWHRMDVLNMILTSIFIEAISILLLIEKEGCENETELKSGCS